MNKETYRCQYKKIRNEIENRQEKSHRICEKILQHPLYQNSETVAFYASTQSEVDTWELLNKALEDQKRVLLPKVEGNDMQFYEINSLDELEKGTMGIYEPIKGKEVQEIDCMIVPGICFDQRCHRIGYGKGYYDRYLSRCQTKTIGICFKEQICDEIKVDNFDIPLDEIISDE